MTAAEAFQAAKAHHRAGRIAQARTLYTQLLAAFPDHTETRHMLGLLTHQAGNAEAGLALIEAALRQQPGRPSIHNNRGLVLQALGRTEDAEDAYREAVRRNPKYAGAWYNLAGLLADTDRLAEAQAAYDTALRHQPSLVDAQLARATLLRRQGQPEAAEAALHDTAKTHPEDARPWRELGHHYRLQGDLPAAIHAYRQAGRRAPRDADVVNNLGAALQMAGYNDDAERCFQRALQLDPSHAGAGYNLARALDEKNDAAGAEAAYARVLAQSPDDARSLSYLAHLRRKHADWTHHEARAEALFAAARAHLAQPNATTLPPLTFALFETPPDLQVLLARQQAEHHAAEVAALRRAAPFIHPTPHHGPLRIGYLSPDFRKHAVGLLVQDLFAQHDRDAVAVFGYSILDVDDPVRRTIEAGCDTFRVINQSSDPEAARQIHADGIDILIDLGGYTSYTRTRIPALCPAPVQAHWLGYLGTMQADFLPYLLADETVVPPAQAGLYSEALVYLPDTFAPVSTMACAARAPSRAEAGLPEDAFVFASFNTHHKLDPQGFQVWLSILAQVPGSVLWLFEGQGPAAQQRLRDAAAAHGITPERIVFAPRLPMDENLARHALADLFLDPFRYNGGTTSVTALTAGVPLLTCPGTTYLSRMGASLLTAAGLPELVCDSPDTYRAEAVRLATTPAALAALRRRLEAAQAIPAPLFDRPRFARHLEAAYRMMWQDHRDGIAPRMLRVKKER